MEKREKGKEFDFSTIERKWQKRWEKESAFKMNEKSKKPKYYVLEMFPYPSSSGLHMGHAFNYSIGDIYARFMRMNKFEVLYPMGYDAFGLPAENAAIKEGVHPKKFTLKSIENFIRQQKAMGLSYDWDKMVVTCEPEYYKWNQFFFLKFLEKGLTYRKKAVVNFCEKCDTVLANEQVHNGKCWRHTTTEVKEKELEQWFIRTTDYAEELLEHIDKLDWPERIKIMQRNWIGKSEGAEIVFKISGEEWLVFTTRPDTLFGVTFLVISAKHPKLMSIVSDKQKKEVEKFVKKVTGVKQEDIDKLDKEGVFTGAYASHPLTGEQIPVWAGNFVLAEYGSGMIMAVPAHDQRDFEFAKKYELPIKQVISSKGNCVIVHGCPSNKEKALDPKKRTYDKHWIPWIKKMLEENGVQTSAPLMPAPWEPKYEEWKRYFDKLDIGENTTLIGHSCGGGFLVRWLGENKRKIKKLILVAPAIIHSGEYKPLLDLLKFEVDHSVKNNVGKIVIFVSNDDSKGILKSVDIFSNFLSVKPMRLTKKGHFTLEDMGTEEFPELLKEVLGSEDLNGAYTGSGTFVNSGAFDGLSSDEAMEHIVIALRQRKLGEKKVQYKLRDWLISRQRYWGTPIPVIYCPKCGIVPVPEKGLPVLLPEKVKFGSGNPLESNKEFLNVKCYTCKGKARRETDTMDTFMDSSWYYLRYIDSENKKEPFDTELAEKWMPVDQYIGGAEHATMHLIYARFFTKALRDFGYVSVGEPFKKLFNQGMLHKSGFVMSKSRGNVVLPEEVSDKYGIDTARLFLVSIASTDKDIEWSDSGIEGSMRFVMRVYNFMKNYAVGKTSEKLESKLHKTIKSVTEEIKDFRYNIAVIKLRELFDFIEKEGKIAQLDLESFIKMLSVFCPHFGEEFWEMLGNKGFVSLAGWPENDEKKINEQFDKDERNVEKTKEDIISIKFILNSQKPIVHLNVIPSEVDLYNQYENYLRTTTGSQAIHIHAVNNKPYKPEDGKIKQPKPGKPAIYFETGLDSDR